jgi:hypothetical protein
MKQDYELHEDLECDIYERMHHLVATNPGTWQSIGAVSGLVGGTLSPVLGTLLIFATWLVHSAGIGSSLNALSIVSFVLTIPLLVFGAHCLDLLERRTEHLPVSRGSRTRNDASVWANDPIVGGSRQS